MFRSALLGAACVLMSVAVVQARPIRSADAGSPPAEGAAQVRSVSAVAPEQQGAFCTHTRRRLWIESEGWIVRKIATCR